jgi:tetratricopeptide (TPR) repeat protein
MTFSRVGHILLLLCVASVPAAAQSADRFEALVGLARVRRDAGDAQAARRYFEQAREVKSLDPSLQTEYFWVLTDVSAADAVAVGLELLAHQPRADDVREGTIAAAIASGDEPAVLAAATAGVQQDPGRALWHRRVAESLSRQRRVVEAVAAWQAAAGATGAGDNDRAGLALALEAAGQDALAVNAWSQVPTAMRQTRPDWERSRLRAVARSASPAEAALDVQTWLAAHPDDTAMREILVDLWARAGQPARALAVLQPLLEGPDAGRWTAREVQLARAAGQTALAIERLEVMAARGRARRADRLMLAELFIESGQFTRAGREIRALSGPTCDGALLELADRIPGAPGTSLLVELLGARDCREASKWITRGIERTTAEGRHPEALALVGTLPSGERGTVAMQRLAGQLHLWTGDAAGAADALAPFVAAHPEDVAARDALVDAHRGAGDSQAAWRVAGPLVESSTTVPARLLVFAEIALEADHPEAVDPILARLPQQAASHIVRLELRGRALAALGRPAEAVRVLSSVTVSELSGLATLALVDSVLATRGVDEAGAIARLAASDGNRVDLLARRLMLDTLAASGVAPAEVRATLAASDPALPALVDAEVALRRQRPFDALAALQTLPPGAHPQRTAALRVAALAGSGNVQAAAADLQTLRRGRPDFTPFILHEAELAWRLRPGADTRAAVLALPSRFPGNCDAAAVAARVLAFEQRHAEVITLLGEMGARTDLPIEGRVLMARSLFAMGRAADALATVADVELRGPDAVFRAELMARVDGPAASDRAFRALADSDEASADLYLAWAGLTPDPRRQLAVLEDGARRFDAHVGLLSRLSVARAAAGDREGSLASAERAVAIDPAGGDAWFQVIAQTAAVRPAGELGAVLDRFGAVAAAKPALGVSVADRVAALVRPPNDPLLTSALGWLPADVADPSLVVSRDLARVRLLAAGERWFEALEAADRAVLAHPESVLALRLRADVLSWAGRHDEGISAYDDYLAVVPDDVDARRQQARVAGWAGRFTDARRLYANLRARYPDDRAIAAESEAKAAFFDGRWQRAVGRYEQWLALEPESSEARFEMAQAVRAAGDAERADATLVALSPTGGHRLAEAAREREAWRREPSVAFVADLSSADGYGGQRLLDLRQSGGGLHSVLGRTGRTTFMTDVTAIQAASADVDRSGYQLGVAGDQRVSRTTALAGRASFWDVSGPAGGPIALASGSVSWAPADRWVLTGGAERELLLDNIDTIDSRIVATGAMAGAAFESPMTSVDVRSSWQRLSDGNQRARLSASATRAVSERLSHVRAVAWAELLDYEQAVDVYFSPRRFLRVDGGLEYAHLFSQPRFRGDRMNQVAFGYLIGTDSNGVIYQHPSFRLGWEMSPSLVLSVRADVIRSRSYNEQSVLVSMHLIGGAFSR